MRAALPPPRVSDRFYSDPVPHPPASELLGRITVGGSPAWRLGPVDGGARLTAIGIEYKKTRHAWMEIERLDLVVDPPPFRRRREWLLANFFSILSDGGVESFYGHVRLSILRRGHAFQTVWNLGRTPICWDPERSSELVRWVSSLVHGAPGCLDLDGSVDRR